MMVITLFSDFTKDMTNLNTKNSGTNEPHRFKLDLTDKRNLKDRKKKHGFS